MVKVFQPSYVRKFTCIAAECDDSCCCGWRIPIDEKTYETYCHEMELDDGAIFTGRLTKAELSSVKGTYAEAKLSDGAACSFLTDNKLCRIQLLYGESYLSNTCFTFPREYSLANGGVELVLAMSCPHAARLALADPEPMKFVFAETKVDPSVYSLPTMNTDGPDYPLGDTPYFFEIRQFVIRLLQNRQYAFEDRLIILGRFCNDLESLRATTGGSVAHLIEEYNALIDSFGLNYFIGTIPNQPALYLKVLIDLIDYKITTKVTSEGFILWVDRFKQGLSYESGLSSDCLSATFVDVKKTYYDNYMQQHEYIFENYFVNYIVKTHFPLGRQYRKYLVNILLVDKTVISEMMLLALQYAFLKNMLVGTAGYLKHQFEESYIIALIQTFAKNIDHDDDYLQKLLKFFSDNHMLNFTGMAMLIKN